MTSFEAGQWCRTCQALGLGMGGTFLGEAKSLGHPSWLLGSLAAQALQSEALRQAWLGHAALSVRRCGLAGGPRGARGRGPACRALCRWLPGVREAQSIQIDTICFPIRGFSVEF